MSGESLYPKVPETTARWSINITCPRCRFRGDVVEDFPVPDAAAIRNAALEEAAELAIAQAKLLIGDYAAFGLCDLANAIRALKTSALDDSAAKVGGCLDDSGGGT